MKTKSYTGYTKTKRYRVIIKPVNADKNTVFSYFADKNDLHQIIRNCIDDFGEEDFQIYMKLTELTEDGSRNVYVSINVNFEESSNLFYVPEPVKVYTESGFFALEATKEYEISASFAAVLNIEDYPIKILEVMDGLFEKNGATSTRMPIYILLLFMMVN